MKNTFLKILFLLLSIHSLWAQQDTQFTQYMYNTSSINPAYAGSREVLSTTALHRSQWLGLDGAPVTQNINIHGPLSNKIGIGLSVINDEIGNGTNQETDFDVLFSYQIHTSFTSKLSFGLSAGGKLLNIDFNQLRRYDSNLGVNAPVIDNKFSPNIGAGIFYYTDKFYAGLSAPNLLKTEHFDTSSDTFLSTERINYYFITGYVTDLRYNLKFKPAFLFKAVNGAPVQADITANLLYCNKFVLGAAYRWDAAWSALLGFQINKKMLLGLGYDREITELGSQAFNDGSFEIFLRFDFLKKEKLMLSPRFF